MIPPQPKTAAYILICHCNKLHKQIQTRQPLLATPPTDGIHQWPLVWYGDGLPANSDSDADETAVLPQPDTPFLVTANQPAPPRQPLPPGRYRLAILAQNEAGAAADAFVDLTVTAVDQSATSQTYLDTRHNFQFQYPPDWQTPVYSDTLLLSRHLTGTIQMQLAVYADLPPGTNDVDLTRQILAQLGPVSRLFQEQLPLANTRAQRAAYGYTHSDNTARVGTLLVFVWQGQGYVIDIEGLAADETAVWQMAGQLAASWQFIPPPDVPAHWQWQAVAGHKLAYPTGYGYQELRGWHRFSRDRDTFWALRLVPEATADSAELARRVQDAAAGVTNFSSDPAYYFELADRQWLRADFRYTNSREQRIQGAILLRTLSEETARTEPVEVAIVWLEAPIDEYDRLAQAYFLLMLAELERND
jgi:hypothetical protein